jgi:hypothetical protein
MHRDITDGPYQISINAEPVYRMTEPSKIDGYRVSAIIKRTDSAPVVGSFKLYTIHQGGIYLSLDSALDDGERQVKLAIANNFPD